MDKIVRRARCETFSLRTGIGVLVLAVAMAAGATAVNAATTPEQMCNAGRLSAAGRYADCMQRAMVKVKAGNQSDLPYLLVADKCIARYANAWVKLQAKATGTGATCDNARLADNGDGTVTDRLTGLQWEKKRVNNPLTPDYADPHDINNQYAWSAGGAALTAGDGSAFTDFLAKLNSGCFAGQCDWRLPTRDELLAISSPIYPESCAPQGCIDPTFGPTVNSFYWSATSYVADPTEAWFVDFGIAHPFLGGKAAPPHVYIRAVRGGGF